MKSSLYYTIFALLLVLSPVLAFAPPTRISKILSVSSTTTTELNGKPARSPEDDLELTRAVIMRHIASTSNDDIVDDGDDDEADDKSSEVEKTRGTRQKIKALGSKVKSKGNKKMKELKKRFSKNESKE